MDKFILEYLQKLTDKLNGKHEKLVNEQTKFKDDIQDQLKEHIKEIKTELAKLDDMEDKKIYMYKLMDKIKNYHIKDGYWYYENKRLDKAVAVDGKDGKNGIDGKNGKDGIDGKNGTNGINGCNGIDGKDGINGTNGKDGRDGIDGLTPIFDVVETETIGSAEYAEVLVTREKNKYKLKFKVPRGQIGKNGPSGRDGTNGQGYNVVEMSLTDYQALEVKDPFTIYHESVVI
jgi:hypothetical protein